MSRRSTLIYTHGGGRLGNQIIRLAHWLAWARTHETRVEVINMGFWRYAEYFEHWHNQTGCAFPLSSSKANFLAATLNLIPGAIRSRLEPRMHRLIHEVVRRCPGGASIALDDPKAESLNLDDPAFLTAVIQRRMTVCSGWKIAGWRSFNEQQPQLRSFFQPRSRWANTSKNFVDSVRCKYDVVAGLLIRQSDYVTWNQGRFYFPVTQYVQWIRQLFDLYAGKRLAVLIMSEERQTLDGLLDLPVYLATGNPGSNGHWFENWIELSLCDFILSPPSTFSATAAFLHGAPLWPLVVANQVLAFDQMLCNPLVDAANHAEFGQSVQ